MACCGCNAKGSCRNCKCKKEKKKCQRCTPSAHDRCLNQPFVSASRPVPSRSSTDGASSSPLDEGASSSRDLSSAHDPESESSHTQVREFSTSQAGPTQSPIANRTERLIDSDAETDEEFEVDTLQRASHTVPVSGRHATSGETITSEIARHTPSGLSFTDVRDSAPSCLNSVRDRGQNVQLPSHDDIDAMLHSARANAMSLSTDNNEDEDDIIIPGTCIFPYDDAAADDSDDIIPPSLALDTHDVHVDEDEDADENENAVSSNNSGHLLAGVVLMDGWSTSAQHSQPHVADATRPATPNPTASGRLVDRGRFCDGVRRAYEIVMKWRRNLFLVPYGSAGGRFVDELAKLIQSFADGSNLQDVAWKAVAVACHLLLQKPNDSRLMGNHAEHLSRRLALWQTGDIDALLAEGKCIQCHLTHPQPSAASSSTQDKDDALFSKLVFSGRVHSALRYLSQDAARGVLRTEDVVDVDTGKTVHDALLEKHPAPAPAQDEVLMPGEPAAVAPILYQRITPELIRNVSRRMNGSSGPSGLDAAAWCRMLTGYKEASNRLSLAMAAAARLLCTASISSEALYAFTCARLIPLDKRPGVRPIAVGEVYRRIICKAIMHVVESDVRRATAPLQICVGIPSACEAAVHTMDTLFSRPEVQGILMIDAANAFNSLNRNAALHNVPRVCPALGQVFVNTYRQPTRLFVSGGGEIWSREGTCQGDPLAMASYAAATMPLVKHLAQACPDITQVWYADDDCAAGNLTDLRHYWDQVQHAGPGYGYNPNPRKTILVTKAEFAVEARQLFSGTGIEVTATGSRYLGGAIGTPEFVENYMAALATKWSTELELLASLAQTQPHAVYTVFTRGVSHQWNYHIRSTACSPDLFKVVDSAITDRLLPALLGHAVPGNSPTRTLMTLPARFGGLAMPAVSESCAKVHEAAKHATQPLLALLVPDTLPRGSQSVGTGGPELSTILSSPAENITEPQLETAEPQDILSSTVFSMRIAARQERKENVERYKEQAVSLRDVLPAHQRLLIETAGEKGVSSWLTTAPSTNQGTVLNKSDFRDGLCIRYGYDLDGIPSKCVCGQDMTTSHALTCPSGGYPMARHNEVRDVLADVLREVVSDVEVEPVLLPLDDEQLGPQRSINRSQEARLDIRARGFWSRQQDAFFDVRVTHPKASLLSRSEVVRQLRSNEREKKRQYCQRVNQVDRSAFTPLVFTTSGMCGPEASVFLKTLVGMIHDKNPDLAYPLLMGRLRAKLSFCLLRWCVTCFRGCRASYSRNRAHMRGLAAECRLLPTSH